MPHPRPLPQDLPEAFTVAEALTLGVSPRRLRARDIATGFWGARAVPSGDEEPDDDSPYALDRRRRHEVLQRVRAYAPVMPAHAFVSGRTAAILHGLPVIPGSDLEIGVTGPHRAPRRPGVIGRHLHPDLLHVVDVEGLRVASPASTWAMLGGDLDVAALIRLGDAVVRIPRDRFGQRHPELALATTASLDAALRAGRRLGAQRLRGALVRIRTGSMSPLETDARLIIVDAGLPEPELDVPIRDATGRLLGISDGVYRERRVAIEVEGDHHRTGVAQWQRDIDKYAAYAAAGWRVVRLTGRDIRIHPHRGVALVRSALA